MSAERPTIEIRIHLDRLPDVEPRPGELAGASAVPTAAASTEGAMDGGPAPGAASGPTVGGAVGDATAGGSLAAGTDIPGAPALHDGGPAPDADDAGGTP